MENAFYFRHDYSARNDQKILMIRSEFNNWEGYGLFFAILECLCEAKGHITRDALGGISMGLNKNKEFIETFINYCIEIDLLDEDEKGIFSERILSHLNFRKMLSEAGRRGGRGKKAPLKAPLKAPPQAGKERKVKKSIEKNSKKYKYVSEISDSLLKEFLEICKKKNKPLTERVWTKTLKECKSINLTPEQAITHAIEKGWARFEAEWVKTEQPQKKRKDL